MFCISSVCEDVNSDRDFDWSLSPLIRHQPIICGGLKNVAIGIMERANASMEAAEDYSVLSNVSTKILPSHPEAPANPLDAKEVVPVRRYVDLVYHLVRQRRDLGVREMAGLGFGRLDLPGGDVVELHAEFEAQLVELVIGVGSAEVGEEAIAGD